MVRLISETWRIQEPGLHDELEFVPSKTNITLPQELVDSIVDFLRFDRKTLASCALLSSAWRLSTQRYLFRVIRLNAGPTSSFDDFRSFVQRDPRVASCVRELCLNLRNDKNGLPMSALQWPTAALPCVEHMRMPDFYRWSAHHESCMPLLARFRGIRRLSLLNSAGLSCNFDMLTSMLVAFPLLERLELGGEWGKPPASWTPDTKKSSPSLKSIAFSGSCSFNLCNLIWGTVSLSRLETLTVHTDFSIRRDKRKLLQHVAPSLRHLQLTGYGPLVLVRPGEHLNLGPLTHLEHLYVNVTISLSRSTPLQWVPGLLSSVSREYVPPLKILTVAYDLGKEEKQKPVSYARYRVLTEWHHLTLADALDLAIGSPVVKGLERVNIVMHYPAERAQIAMLFPSLQARDVLRVYVGVGDDQELMWPLRDSIFDF